MNKDIAAAVAEYDRLLGEKRDIEYKLQDVEQHVVKELAINGEYSLLTPKWSRINRVRR